MRANLPLIKNLDYIKRDDLFYGEAFGSLQQAHGAIAIQLGADPNGAEVVPTQPAAFRVQAAGNLVDFEITDNSPTLLRSIQYFVEYGTDQNFTNPRVHSLGPSRNGTMSLPPGTYYFRVRSQYPHGGPASSPNTFSQPVIITSGTAMTLFPSQGAGTGGGGAGKTITR